MIQCGRYLVCLDVCLSACRSVFLSVGLPVCCLYVGQFVWLPDCLFVSVIWLLLSGCYLTVCLVVWSLSGCWLSFCWMIWLSVWLSVLGM